MGEGIDTKELVTQCRSFCSCGVALRTALFAGGLAPALLLTVRRGHHRAGLISTFSGPTRSLRGFPEGRDLHTPGKRLLNNVQ